MMLFFSLFELALFPNQYQFIDKVIFSTTWVIFIISQLILIKILFIFFLCESMRYFFTCLWTFFFFVITNLFFFSFDIVQNFLVT